MLQTQPWCSAESQEVGDLPAAPRRVVQAAAALPGSPGRLLARRSARSRSVPAAAVHSSAPFCDLFFSALGCVTWELVRYKLASCCPLLGCWWGQQGGGSITYSLQRASGVSNSLQPALRRFS